jgi:hypothetical protein
MKEEEEEVNDVSSIMTARNPRTPCHLPWYVRYVSPWQKLSVSGADSSCSEYRATSMTFVFEEEKAPFSESTVFAQN